jgi:hypothetical protein
MKPFDGNSNIVKYILRIQYKQGKIISSWNLISFCLHLGASWSNETIITVDNNEITNYSFENIFSKCMISVVIQAVNFIGSSLPSDPIHFQTTVKRI